MEPVLLTWQLYGMPKSTISSILKTKDAIKRANVAKEESVLTVNGLPIIEQVKKHFTAEIKEQKTEWRKNGTPKLQ